MAKKKNEITSVERSAFTFSEVTKAGKWIVLSGTATFFLTELAKLVSKVEQDLPSWLILIIYFAINVSIYAVAKFVEGHE